MRLKMLEGAALEDVRIAAPCPEPWSQMAGDERVRRCARCELDVFNLSGMTRNDAQALLASRAEGRVCVRLYRRADGTVTTSDCRYDLMQSLRVGARASFRWGLLAAQLALAVLVGVLTLGAAATIFGRDVRETFGGGLQGALAAEPARPRPAPPPVTFDIRR